MHARLAADTARAAQLERKAIQQIRELRLKYLGSQAQGVANGDELIHELSLLLSAVRELPSEPLRRKWPDLFEAPMLLHSAYREGNMSLVLQFLLTGSEEGRVDVVTANFDYAHVKLLEELHKTHNSIRVVCNSGCHELFENRSISQVTSVRPNLHCRFAVTDRLAMISSADMNADFVSHVEAGVIIETKAANPSTFAETVLAGSIPLLDYHIGLNKARYRTTHVLFRVRHNGTTSESVAMIPSNEISSEIYQILFSSSASGYVDTDEQGAFFVNIAASNLNAQLVDQITATCSLEFHDWVSVMPIQDVIDLIERDPVVAQKVVGNDSIVLLYFCSDSESECIARARKMEKLACDVNSCVRCLAISRDKGKILYGSADLNESFKYLCIVDQSGLAALSPIMSKNELDVHAISRYLDSCRPLTPVEQS
jgi:hypothetical protein